MSAPAMVKCLIVDDLSENLVALEALLTQPDVQVLRAHSGQEALELLLVHDIALALIDVQMPEMDGYELAELMRGTEKTRRVPIMFLTAGYADSQRSFRGYEAGAVDFLSKPIETHTLRSKANVFFELYRERQEVLRQRDELALATSENARLLKESQTITEALRLADKRKDEFLATLAHELRNPLAPIANGLQILRTVQHDPQAVDEARAMMERQLQHLVRLVDDLLDVSRVTSGKVQLRREHLELKSVVDAAVESTKSVFESGQHRLQVTLPPEPLFLYADQTRLVQIIGNLLSNAAKYTPQGGHIQVDARTEDGVVLIRVKDSGIGIPQEMLHDVFTLFTQVGSAIERSQGGLGIGLALVKKLAELHGGQVSAESQGVGYGSTFTVSLPLNSEVSPTPPQPRQVVQSLDTNVAASISNKRILIVDDNIDSAESLSKLLELDGYQTRTVHSGTDALDAVCDFAPEAVFLDIGLPGMDGYRVAEAICNGAQRPVLIAVTGWGSEQDRQRAKQAGFDYHLTKPLEFDELQEILHKIGG